MNVARKKAPPTLKPIGANEFMGAFFWHLSFFIGVDYILHTFALETRLQYLGLN